MSHRRRNRPNTSARPGVAHCTNTLRRYASYAQAASALHRMREVGTASRISMPHFCLSCAGYHIAPCTRIRRAS